MTISITELRKRVKKTKGYHNLFSRGARHISIYVTWLFIHTNITANQITVLSAIVGVVGSLFFLYKNPIYWVLGYALIQGYQLLDHVDGEVARYRKSVSEYGKYLEHLSGLVINVSVFLFATIGLYFIFNDTIIIVFGLLAALSKMSFPYVKKYNPKKDNKIVALSREVGGFFQFIIVPILLDLIVGGAYFRALFIIASGIIFPLLFLWRFARKRSL